MDPLMLAGHLPPSQESIDLAEFKAKRSEIQDGAFKHMREILRYSPEMLKASGYPSKEAAVVGAYEFAQKNIDELLKKHLKKYPD
jgi:predicted translin family RNA/ssDNA-binding protein